MVQSSRQNGGTHCGPGSFTGAPPRQRRSVEHHRLAETAAPQRGDKGAGLPVAEGPIDGGLEIDDALEDAVFEPLPGELGEKPLDGVEPEGRGRGQVEMEPRMSFEPRPHLGVPVRRVIVDDQVQLPPGRGLAVDLVEEADECLMPMARDALADDLAFIHVEAANSVVVAWRF